jgi:TfoX/Sxy family transcriptional regulator of competence genes
MPVDPQLRDKVREHLKRMPGIEEKAMFGGVGFTLRGKLLCGVMEDELLVRIAKTDFDKFIGDKGAKPMTMAGKTGKSWILIPKSVVSRKPVMKKWIDRAISFVGSLPNK